MRRFRLLSLCSGIGVIDYVWCYVLGQVIAGQVEIDPYCLARLTERFPGVPRRSDIKEVACEEPPTDFGTVDIVAGGIPCQPFSNAGKRRGTEDDRYLWPYALTLIQRYRPTWVLIENVAGFVNLALDIVAADLESENYTTRAFVLPACGVGAPHERQRVFIMAHSTGSRRQVGTAGPQYPDQSDASIPLAHANSLRESSQGGSLTCWQCSATQPAGVCRGNDSTQMADAQGSECRWLRSTWARGARPTNGGEDVAHGPWRRQQKGDNDPFREWAGNCNQDVAHANGNRRRVRPGQSQQERECGNPPNAGGDGTQRDMAHAYVSGLQIRDWCPGLAWAPVPSHGRAAGQSESRLGRGLDGAADWLDQTRWPAPPGELQYTWEPPRIVTTKRDRSRAQRLKALGNAIVPQQIYPILYAILEMMRSQQ